MDLVGPHPGAIRVPGLLGAINNLSGNHDTEDVVTITVLQLPLHNDPHLKQQDFN